MKKLLAALLILTLSLSLTGCYKLDFLEGTSYLSSTEQTISEVEMVDYLQMTFEDIKLRFGQDYKVYEMSGWIPDLEGSDRVIRYNSENTNLEFQVKYSYGEIPQKIGDNTLFDNIRFANNTATMPITVIDDIKTNIEYGELRRQLKGSLCECGVDDEYLYIHKTDENCYIVFDYFEYPTDTTVAQFVYVSKDSLYEDIVRNNTTSESVSQPMMIKDNTPLTVTGTLVETEYEINPNNKGTVYILNLEEPIKCKFYNDFMGYNGEEKTVESIQVNISKEEYEQNKSKSVTLNGQVMFGHTGHHLRDIVLMECNFK